MAQSTYQVTKQNWIADNRFQLPVRRWTISRVAFHVLFWAWNIYSSYKAFDRILRVDPELPPEQNLFWLIYLTHVGTTALVFYLYGYLVLPTLLTLLLQLRIEVQEFINTGQTTLLGRMRRFRTMFRLSWRRIAYVSLSGILVYIFFYVFDYYLYRYALTYVTVAPPYITRNATLLTSAGFTGIYNNYSTFVFIFAYNISYILTPLFLRAVFSAIAWGVESNGRKDQNQLLIKNQLTLLQNQINPHFLFNVFNNIHALIEQTNAEAAELLKSLSDLLKYTIYETGKPFVELSGELKFLRDYIDIEKSRQFNPDRITFQVFGDSKDLLIPPLLLITFVENAFKHGIHKNYHDGWVQLAITIDATQPSLHMQIENLKGAVASVKGPSGGVGLVNARKRLNLLYQQEYTLTMNETDSVYQVSLIIPLKSIVSHVPELEPTH